MSSSVIWKLIYSRRAAKSLRRFPRDDQVRLLAQLGAMQDDPLAGNVKALRSHPISFRRRAGNYRILFDLDHVASAVLIHDITRRSESTYR
jgi:mRNA interferase RelE/StbE